MIPIEDVDAQFTAPFQYDDVEDRCGSPQLTRQVPAAIISVLACLVQLDNRLDILHRLDHGPIRRRIVVVVLGDPAQGIPLDQAPLHGMPQTKRAAAIDSGPFCRPVAVPIPAGHHFEYRIYYRIIYRTMSSEICEARAGNWMNFRLRVSSWHSL